MSKPLIGVTPLWDDHLNSMWMLSGYFDGIIAAGGTPVMMPLSDDAEHIEQLSDTCDGFLFAGGHDINPNLYGQQPTSLTKTCPARDRMESLLLPAVLKRNKAVLGICRGIQVINALLGGTLWQDLPTEHPSNIDHHVSHPPHDRVVHQVQIMPHSPLDHALWPNGDTTSRADDAFHPACRVLGVNSRHHQAIKQLAPPLSPMALSPDGLVEAVYMPSARFVWAVQWHPEFSYQSDANQRAIFSAFVQAAAQS
ncbi:amidotransferase [Bifidobacterium sp. DSM 109963]|uniref:Amidotransferase n=2 Tax=Bifidobacterium panos TaxID=2675321 RepID=A0ABX1SYC6_9BIFI|nr:gamma-glutamyl-gamma-aminobutyrate hydrolase family protein [Bifidobacterium sp. DSM 109963]NMN02132.1 amidotransferase [Bifidobacterium sp. DSM 109963]